MQKTIKISILTSLVLSLFFCNISAEANKIEITAELQNEILNIPEINEYFKEIRAKVLQNCYLYYTVDEEGEVTVFFDLLPNGKLDKSSIEFSDNSKNLGKLQKIVTRALKKSSPFPKFPEALGTKPLKFEIKINFEDDTQKYKN